MEKKNTQELEQLLGHTHVDDFGDFLKENEESMMNDNDNFGQYLKKLMQKKGLTQHTVFLDADIPERYGYKILSGEKHTKQRDIILRLCYAAELNLDETQRALIKYGMSQLYVKIPRDALLMIIFNEHPGSIQKINSILEKNGLEALKSSGTQD